MASRDEPLALKVAARFAKTGPARFHSHHDLMRFWERALRRADWPLRRTAGFNPHPRLVFPHALGVGVASTVEEVEIELREVRPLPALTASLAPALAPTLRLVDLALLPPTRKGRVARQCAYRIDGWPEGFPRERLDGLVAELVGRTEWIVERGPPRERTKVDVRPYLAEAEARADDAGLWVRVALAHTERGAGRIDEVARALASATGLDAAALNLEKIAMTLE